MSNVIMFPRHRRERCASVCDRCENYGGDCTLNVLFSCAVCGGAEASLPTHCPGARMDQTMASSVQMGIADFRNGEWWFYEYRAREVFDA